GMGGAQPLAVTMNEGVAICVEVDESRIDKRLETKYLDVKAYSLKEALKLAGDARDAGKPLSIGLLGNAAEILPESLGSDCEIDVVTDQTSPHDPLNCHVPECYSFEEAAKMREQNPAEYVKVSSQSMAEQVDAMLD